MQFKQKLVRSQFNLGDQNACIPARRMRGQGNAGTGYDIWFSVNPT